MRVCGFALASISALVAAASCSSSGGHATAALADGGAGGESSASQGGGTSSRTRGASSEGTVTGSARTESTAGRTSTGETRADASAATCLGASLLGDLGKTHLMIGGSMEAATAAKAPFDLQYVYISGGLPDGSGPCASCASGCTTNGTTCANSGPGCAWWGCWQYDVPPPGDYVRTFASTWTTAKPAQVPMITYYQLLQSSGVAQGAPEVQQAATDATFMARYFADWRFLLQQIGTTKALLHIEPDFWGFAEQLAEDATTLPAAVASANSEDCGALPNTIAGMGRCMIGMTRKYAPHAKVGLHASAWSTNVDVSLNTSATLDVAAEARKTAAFLAACGEASADFVVVETSDRDAGYYQTVESKDTWWDDTNAKLPNFHQDFAWVTALTEALAEPALWWQTPLGNMQQNETADHYQDNRVDYFLTHTNELAAAHGVGVAFGPGAAGQTTPETDGGNFVAKANAYFSGGAENVCP